MDKEKQFLEFNKDEVFKNLLAAEGHFRNLLTTADKSFLSCIVKHLADAESHADEAISHSLAVEGAEKSSKWSQLRDQIRNLRKRVQAAPLSREEGIKAVRQIRRFFESFNEEYDVSRCSACGPIDEILEKLKIPKTHISEIEYEAADKMLTLLSAKYNAPKPQLQILDKCPAEPQSFGLFTVKEGKPQIIMCRGGVNPHVLAHEFKHYLDYLKGKQLSEEEAEKFAVNEVSIEKVLKYHPIIKRAGMTTWVDVGVIYGGQHIGKGLARGFIMLDAQLGKQAEPLERRPSTWLTIGLSVALPILAVYKLKDPIDKIATLIGGYLSTTIWEYVEELTATAGGGTTAATPTIIASTPIPTPPPPTATVTATPTF